MTRHPDSELAALERGRPYTREELEGRRHAARVRRRTRRIDLIIIVAFAIAFLILGWRATAAPAYSYPGERPVVDELVEESLAIGYRFWQERDVAPCPRERLEVLIADDLGDETVPGEFVAERGELGYRDGAGELVPGCRLWVSVWMLTEAREDYAYTVRELARTRYRTLAGAGMFSSSSLADLCTVILHGMGHNAGLRFDNPEDPAHSPEPGLMGAELSDEGRPFVCARWARVKVESAAGRRRARLSRLHREKAQDSPRFRRKHR